MAHGLAEGKTQLEAYKAAGFTGKTPASAGVVALRADVKARVSEIIAARHRQEIRSEERAIEKAAIDKSWIVARAKYVVDRAVRGTKPMYNNKGENVGWLPAASDNGAAIDGLTLLAKMGGFLINLHEIGQPGDFSRMSNEELDGELIEIGKAIGIPETAIQKAITGR